MCYCKDMNNIEQITEQTICNFLRTLLLNFYLDEASKPKQANLAMESVLISFKNEPQYRIN